MYVVQRSLRQLWSHCGRSRVQITHQLWVASNLLLPEQNHRITAPRIDLTPPQQPFLFLRMRVAPHHV